MRRKFWFTIAACISLGSLTACTETSVNDVTDNQLIDTKIEPANALEDNQETDTATSVVDKPVVAESVVVEEQVDSFSQPAYYVAPYGNDSNEGSIDSPWRTIKSSLSKLKAGDTLLIRGGTYFESHIASFPVNEATASARITIKNYADETVIVNGGMDLSDESLWEQQGDTDVYKYIYAENVTYDNISQDSQPLRLMNKSDTSNTNELTGEGQWIRNNGTDGIWVRAKGGGNPGKYNIEISSAYNVFSIPQGADYITLEGIIVENAYYAVQVRSDHVELKNLVARNTYGDGLKVEGWNRTGDVWNSEYGLIEDCDIYYFGESAIDITGGDYWTVRGNQMHDAVANRPGDLINNGIMAKNENIGLLVENNILYDMVTRAGAVILGMNGYYDDRPQVTGAVIRNNEFRNITGHYYIMAFRGAVDSTFENNLIVDSSAPALFEFGEGFCEKTACLELNNGEIIRFQSEGNSVIDNNFQNNVVQYTYNERTYYGLDNDTSTIIENNTSTEDRNSDFDDRVFTPEELAQEKGYY